MNDASFHPSPSDSPKRKVRILYVTTVPMSLRFVEGHLAHLRTRGYEIHLASSPEELLDQIGRSAEATTHPVRISRPIRIWQDLRSLVALWRLIRRLRPDIVHCYTPKAGLLGTIAARLAGVPVVALSVFGLPQMTRRGPMRWLLDLTTRLSCRLAEWVWCDSPSMREFMVAHRLCRHDKLVVLGHGSVGGIDSSEVFRPDRYSEADRAALLARYGIPAEAMVLGFVGRIARDKGMRELACAWQQLRSRHDDLHLLLVGPVDDRDRPASENLQPFQNDERVHFTGMQDDVALHLAAMDVFVNPSYREGFGLANLEASAMELPVVSTRIPGCVDSVQEGATGLLVPPRDAAALQAAINSLLGDAAVRSRLGTTGRERVVRYFQPAELWRELEQAYARLLARAGVTANTPSQVLVSEGIES